MSDDDDDERAAYWGFFFFLINTSVFGLLEFVLLLLCIGSIGV